MCYIVVFIFRLKSLVICQAAELLSTFRSIVKTKLTLPTVDVNIQPRSTTVCLLFVDVFVRL